MTESIPDEAWPKRGNNRQHVQAPRRALTAFLSSTPTPVPDMSVAVQTPPNGLLNGEANGVNGDAEAPHVARFASGLILPPPEIKCTCFQS